MTQPGDFISGWYRCPDLEGEDGWVAHLVGPLRVAGWHSTDCFACELKNEAAACGLKLRTGDVWLAEDTLRCEGCAEYAGDGPERVLEEETVLW
jgi:hypothetical protein